MARFGSSIIAAGVVSIRGDTGPLEKDLLRTKTISKKSIDGMNQDAKKLDLDPASKQVTSLQSKIGAITFHPATLAATAFGAGFVTIMGKSIKAASDLEEASSKFDVVFGDAVNRMAPHVQELQKNYALSETATKTYLASVQDLLVPMGMAADSASDMSVEVVKLSSDLGSFNNLPTERVMADIQSALVGNFETMKKYGVVLNATTVTQKALNLGLAKTAKELTVAQKAQAAWALILEDTQAAQGDMIRTSDSYANTVKNLQARWGGFTAALGKEFLPVATKVVGMLAEFVEKDGPKIVRWLDSVIDSLIATKKVLGDVTTAFGKYAREATSALDKVLGGYGVEDLPLLEIKQLHDELSGVQDALIRMDKATSGWAHNFDRSGREIEGVVNEVGRSIKEVELKFDDWGMAISKTERTAMDAFLNMTRHAKSHYEGLDGLSQKSREAIISDMQKVERSSGETTEKMQLSYANTFDKINRVTAEHEKQIKEVHESTKDSWIDWSTTVQYTVSDLMQSGIKGELDAFENIWDSFLNALLRQFTDNFAKQVVSGFGDILSGAKSASSGIGGLFRSIPVVGPILGGIGSIFGFQHGLQIAPRDMPAFIHEGEMIVPKQTAEEIRSIIKWIEEGGQPVAGRFPMGSGGGGFSLPNMGGLGQMLAFSSVGRMGGAGWLGAMMGGLGTTIGMGAMGLRGGWAQGGGILGNLLGGGMSGSGLLLGPLGALIGDAIGDALNARGFEQLRDYLESSRGSGFFGGRKSFAGGFWDVGGTSKDPFGINIQRAQFAGIVENTLSNMAKDLQEWEKKSGLALKELDWTQIKSVAIDTQKEIIDLYSPSGVLSTSYDILSDDTKSWADRMSKDVFMDSFEYSLDTMDQTKEFVGGLSKDINEGLSTAGDEFGIGMDDTVTDFNEISKEGAVAAGQTLGIGINDTVGAVVETAASIASETVENIKRASEQAQRATAITVRDIERRSRQITEENIGPHGIGISFGRQSENESYGGGGATSFGEQSTGESYGYQHGTMYVPRTGPAFLHQGEIVIPKHKADAIRGGGGGPVDIRIRVDEGMLKNLIRVEADNLRVQTHGMSNRRVYR